MKKMRAVDKARYILNVLFLLGAAVAMILYFSYGGGAEFMITGAVAMAFKVMEFILRFVN